MVEDGEAALDPSDGFVGKPIEVAQLLEAIRGALDEAEEAAPLSARQGG